MNAKSLGKEGDNAANVATGAATPYRQVVLGRCADLELKLDTPKGTCQTAIVGNRSICNFELYKRPWTVTLLLAHLRRNDVKHVLHTSQQQHH